MSREPLISSDLTARFCRLDEDAERRDFSRQHPELLSGAVVEQLCEEAARWVRIDLRRAERLARSSRWIAGRLDDATSLARSRRAEAHILYFKLEYRPSRRLYDLAVEGFEAVGDELEAAITRTSAIGNLMYLGEYELAREWILRARKVFEELGDELRLARLQSNYGTLLGRMDRWDEALVCYRESHAYFSSRGEVHDAGVALRNISVCHIMRNSFDDALAGHQEVRRHCQEFGLKRLELENEYNIAYLYYLRGEYARALQLYQAARRRCVAEDDAYHEALCDLDEAEIYIELNLNEEAVDFARKAYATFHELETHYEAAKSLTNLAVALSRRGEKAEALRILQEARRMFKRENNPLWQAWVDLYRGVILFQDGRYSEGLELARQTHKFFSGSGLMNKAVLCDLLVSELLLAAGKNRESALRCRQALETLGGRSVPALEYRAHLVLGQIEEANGDAAKAIAAYRRSQAQLDRLCHHLPADHLKIAFLEDKLQVYESLVWLSFHGGAGAAGQEELFEIVEKAKSRSLTDMLALRAHTLPPRSTVRVDLVERVKTLREGLAWHYRQLDRRELSAECSTREIERLRHGARCQEHDLLRTLRDLAMTDLEFSSLQSGAAIDLANVRSSMSDGAVLLQYFIARGTIYAGVVTRDDVRLLPVAEAARVADLQRLLMLQLSKLRLRHPAVQRSLEVIHQATRAHLRELYCKLIAPVQEWLTPTGRPTASRHLIVVPHGFLHHVPFHALFDGDRYLVDRFPISYSPSAGVFHLSTIKTTRPRDDALVLGVADDRAPHILREVRTVAAQLPGAKLLLGTEADEEALRRHGSYSRYVHIATHGIFRRDNPMFSAIQLGTSRLSLFDFYHLTLNAELVVLSGCGTGLNAAVGAEEFVGLARGLLYAGARSALVTLWDVDDVSTAQFMHCFYRHLRRSPSRSEALRRAMIEVRESWPHPFFWAPFVLIGDPGRPQAA